MALVGDCYDPALAVRAEGDLAVARREDRVVTAHVRTGARAKAAAALADDDHPGLHLLAVEDLHPKTLRVRVAPVARGPESFLVRHLALLLLRGRGFLRGGLARSPSPPSAGARPSRPRRRTGSAD